MTGLDLSYPPKAGSGYAPEYATTDLPVAPREVFLVTLSAGLGYAFDAYAVNLLGMLGPTLMAAMQISLRTFGLIGSIFLVGYTLGTIGFGMLADRVGRRDVLG